MVYPKPVMRVSELVKMGFTKDYLIGLYSHPKQDFAWKQNMTKRNSPILFDTEKFEIFRQEQIKLERKAVSHRMAVM